MNTKLLTRANVLAMYLDYVNNFLTIARFAEYYQISEFTAVRIINIGRKLQNSSKNTLGYTPCAYCDSPAIERDPYYSYVCGHHLNKFIPKEAK